MPVLNPFSTLGNQSHPSPMNAPVRSSFNKTLRDNRQMSYPNAQPPDRFELRFASTPPLRLEQLKGSGNFNSYPYTWETLYYYDVKRDRDRTPIGNMKWVNVQPSVASTEGSKDAVGQMAASLVAQQLRDKPSSVIIFPTGNTPKPMYKALREMTDLSWKDATLFHLDEYVTKPELGLTQDQTYKHYMNQELWIGSNAENAKRRYYLQDYLHDPSRYEAKIEELGAPDLVILGIGGNGHIAFIEPGFDPKEANHVHRVTLAPKTIQDNFPHRKAADKPEGSTGYTDEAVTLGLKTILSAKHIILLATGESKRDILRKAFLEPSEGSASASVQPPTHDIPASFLKHHPNVTVITDVAFE